MDELSMKFNRMIMEEIGVEVGPRNRLYDQDSGAMLQFEGKDLVAPGFLAGRESQEFDPYNSTKMMSQMFTYFTNKLVETGEADEYNVIYNVDDGKGRGYIEMKNDSDIMTSKSYQREQCKYADLILQLNGDDNPNLTEFDIPKTKETIKKKKSAVKKKEGTKDGKNKIK